MRAELLTYIHEVGVLVTFGVLLGLSVALGRGVKVGRGVLVGAGLSCLDGILEQMFYT